jgi:hypothetical protein
MTARRKHPHSQIRVAFLRVLFRERLTKEANPPQGSYAKCVLGCGKVKAMGPCGCGSVKATSARGRGKVNATKVRGCGKVNVTPVLWSLEGVKPDTNAAPTVKRTTNFFIVVLSIIFENFING